MRVGPGGQRPGRRCRPARAADRFGGSLGSRARSPRSRWLRGEYRVETQHMAHRRPAGSCNRGVSEVESRNDRKRVVTLRGRAVAAQVDGRARLAAPCGGRRGAVTHRRSRVAVGLIGRIGRRSPGCGSGLGQIPCSRVVSQRRSRSCSVSSSSPGSAMSSSPGTVVHLRPGSGSPLNGAASRMSRSRCSAGSDRIAAVQGLGPDQAGRARLLPATPGAARSAPPAAALVAHRKSATARSQLARRPTTPRPCGRRKGYGTRNENRRFSRYTSRC